MRRSTKAILQWLRSGEKEHAHGKEGLSGDDVEIRNPARIYLSSWA
jgi:hypothetical protein